MPPISEEEGGCEKKEVSPNRLRPKAEIIGENKRRGAFERALGGAQEKKRFQLKERRECPRPRKLHRLRESGLRAQKTIGTKKA